MCLGHAETGEHTEVLGVLDQLGSRAQGCHALEGVDHGPARRPILRARVEPVHGVDDAGHPGGAGGHPAVEARLGVMGMDDVGIEPPEEPPQLVQRHDVLADRDGPRRVSQGLVTDAPRLQLGHVRSRSRHPDDLHAGLGERSELGAEQEHQAHVHRGDVDQPLPDQPAQRARATRR